MYLRLTPRFRATVEFLEQRRFLAFAASINFQPAGAPLPPGYLADTGAVYADRGNGLTYGWDQSATTATRDRDNPVSPDQRYDTFVHTQLYGTRTWEIALPNGTYSVHLAAGDANYFDSTIGFNAEGVLVVSGTPSKTNRFLEGTKTITVSDGKLTISNADGASNNKLCFIDITSAGTNLPTVSIAASDSTASEAGSTTGTFKITRTGSTSSSLAVALTIGGSATNGSDYTTIGATVTIPAGASSANIVISPINDTLIEGSENVILTLASGGSYAIGSPAAATVTIADDDAPTGNSKWPTQWTVGPNNTRTRWESAAVNMDGKIWNFNGWFSSSINGTHDYAVYDPTTNKWTDLGQDKLPVTHSLPAPDPANHVIYFLGGLDGDYPGTPTNKVWKYNTLTNTWTDMPPMPEVHSSGGAVLINNELHYFGGVGQSHDINIARHIVYNLNNPALGWQTAPDMPTPRDHFSTAILNGHVYAFGGEFGHDKQHLQQSIVQSYDPIAKTWTRLADMPTPKSHTEASTFVTPSGKFIVAGGQIANFGVSDEVAQYDPATNTWSVVGKLPRAMEGPVVQQIGNMLIVTTGNPGGGPINSTWIGMLS